MEIDTVFDGLELSEEATAKIKTIFESAVAQQVKTIEESLNEKVEEYKAEVLKEFETKSDEYHEYLKEEYESAGEKLVEDYNTTVSDLEIKAEAYLTESVKEWISENQVAVTNSLKLQKMESFVSGMRTLFLENQIDIPETELSVANEYEKQVAELQEANSVLTNRLRTVLDESFAAQKQGAFEKISEGLTALQVEKLQTLSENLEAKNIDEYQTKLKTLVEAFVITAPTKTLDEGKMITENSQSDKPQGKVLSPQEAYRQAIRG